MRCARVFLIAALCTASACQEVPFSPVPSTMAPSRPNASDVDVSAIPACTHHWNVGVNGDWDDPAMWTPASVPGLGDSACIDAIGTYTVTATQAVLIDGLRVGSAQSSPTVVFHPGFATFEVRKGTIIRANATFEVQQDGGAVVQFKRSAGNDGLTNRGTLRVVVNLLAGAGVTVVVHTLINSGTIDFALGQGEIMVGGNGITNTGTIAMQGEYTLRMEGNQFVQAGGSIHGDSTLIVENGNFVWTGGVLEENGNEPGRAVTELHLTDLTLGDTSLVGMVSVVTGLGPIVVQGDVGPGVELFVSGASPGVVTLEGLTGGGMVNHGILWLLPQSLLSPPLYTGVSLRNEGILRIGEVAADGLVVVALDSLVNIGVLSLNQSLTFDQNGGVVRNAGTLQARVGEVLTVKDATFRNDATGTQDGILILDFATLTGLGTVGDVDARHSHVSPGAPIGTLVAQSVVFDGPSSYDVDVAGTTPGTHDQLVILGDVAYGGASLNVINVAPFLGGFCGQVVPIITDNSSGARGVFGKFSGLSPGPGRAWRTASPTGVLDLAGYNPPSLIGTSTGGFTVAEGGVPGSYHLCLSTAPIASVTVTATPTAQAAVTGSPAVFGTTGWELPKTITVAAIDDPIIEPPQSVLVAHAVVSADPNYNGAPVFSVPVQITDNDGSTDLALTIVTGPPPLVVGQVFTVDFRSTNNGPTLSTGATFVVPPIAGVRYESSIGATCTVDSVTGLTCHLTGIPSGGQVAFSITARATAGGVFAVPMSLTAHQADANLANNLLVRNIMVQ